MGGIIVDPSEELSPTIRIAPFSNKFLYRSLSSYKQLSECESFLKKRFGTYYVFNKARSCIDACLRYYNVKEDDVVTILTTSGNYYVSSCITKTIEKYCKFSREIEPKTRILFVNHEFGYPITNWEEIISYGLPIIEDCAYTLLTEDTNIGKYSDFVIYSLPKLYPMQMGAILQTKVVLEEEMSSDDTEYVIEQLSHECHKTPQIIERRLNNYHYLENKLSGISIRPFFELRDGIVPGVFLFSWREDIDYQDLKIFMQRNGVECSVFYGENAFFIPLHQELTECELNYMCDLLHFYYYNYYEV